MLPYLWAEGFDTVALRVVRQACDEGEAFAAEALDDLEVRGLRSQIARAIVLRLAAAVAARMRATWN